MSDKFRELLQRIGSGTHTSKDLTREEAAIATKMMLQQEATPAQIGAFMIAHRLKRPTGEELAGMLDAYDELGPHLEFQQLPFAKPVTVFGNPYDGRSRTAPVTPITALILAAAGVPVVLHGGETMPTKYGIPLVAIWQSLGLDYTHLSLSQSQELLEKTGLGFIYLPLHFPLANDLVPYREQIGKRPPIATLELIWSPSWQNVHIVSGFVHPPTEAKLKAALACKGVTHFTTVKGLEGSCDLPLGRTAIIGQGNLAAEPSYENLFLHPTEYGFPHKDTPLESLAQLTELLQLILQGQACELMPAAIYNGGFYLWRLGVCRDLQSGFAQAEVMLKEGKVQAKLTEIARVVD